MVDRQPPTNDEIREYVEQILHGADLEKLTMRKVCKQVFSHYPGFDLAHRKDYIKATIMSVINSEPNMAQMEKLVQFLEENPEIATGTGQAENARGSPQTTQKWEAIANELNSMGGEIKSGESWAEFWDLLRIYIKRVIAERKSARGSRRVLQLYPRAMMEQMIILLGGPGNEEIPAELPSDDEIIAYVEQIYVGADLGKMWRKAVYKHLCSYYPDIDLAQHKDFFKATIKSTITSPPSIAQMEKLVKFLEENPTWTRQKQNAHESLQKNQQWEALANELKLLGGENRCSDAWEDTENSQPSIAQMEKLVQFLEENLEIARGTGQAENASGSPQTTQKWEAIANELNLLEGENRTSDSWAEFWDVLRSHLNQIIADKNSIPGFRGGDLHQYPQEIMERLIILLGGPRNQDVPPAPSNDTIKNYVKRICVDLGKTWRKTMYKQVCSHYPDVDLTHKKDFIKATIKSVIQTQIDSKHATKTEDLNILSSGNVLQYEEGPSTSRPEASDSKFARRAAKRNRRTRAQAMRRPAAVFNIGEGRLQVNLRSAEALSSYGATAEHIGAFIAACSNRIAIEIERRNTPN